MLQTTININYEQRRLQKKNGFAAIVHEDKS